MLYKSHSVLPDHVKVVFALPAAIWADQIAVVGDFNDWSPTATPLHQDEDDVWRAAVDLPTGGRYTFGYVVDGRPLLEYPADGFTTSAGGAVHSIVIASLPGETRPMPWSDTPGQHTKRQTKDVYSSY